MTREWKFVRYKSPRQTIRGVVLEDHKGIHKSGAEMPEAGTSRGGWLRFMYKFEGRELNLRFCRCEDNWEPINKEPDDSPFQIAPTCEVDMEFSSREHRQEIVKSFEGAPFDTLVDHLCSYLREFHHSAELYLLPLPEPIDKTIKVTPITKDDEFYKRRKVKIRKFQLGHFITKHFNPKKVRFNLRGDEE